MKTLEYSSTLARMYGAAFWRLRTLVSTLEIFAKYEPLNPLVAEQLRFAQETIRELQAEELALWSPPQTTELAVIDGGNGDGAA